MCSLPRKRVSHRHAVLVISLSKFRLDDLHAPIYSSPCLFDTGSHICRSCQLYQLPCQARKSSRANSTYTRAVTSAKAHPYKLAPIQSTPLPPSPARSPVVDKYKLPKPSVPLPPPDAPPVSNNNQTNLYTTVYHLPPSLLSASYEHRRPSSVASPLSSTSISSESSLRDNSWRAIDPYLLPPANCTPVDTHQSLDAVLATRARKNLHRPSPKQSPVPSIQNPIVTEQRTSSVSRSATKMNTGSRYNDDVQFQTLNENGKRNREDFDSSTRAVERPDDRVPKQPKMPQSSIAVEISRNSADVDIQPPQPSGTVTNRNTEGTRLPRRPQMACGSCRSKKFVAVV